MEDFKAVKRCLANDQQKLIEELWLEAWETCGPSPC